MRHRVGFMAVLALLAPAPVTAGSITDRIYPAPKTALSLDGLAPESRLVEVTSADGLTLKGIAIPARAGKPVVLVFHGNGSSAADTMRWFAPLIGRGYGVIAAEYRGYSANPGKPDEAGLAADADAFFAYAQTQRGDAPLWVVGHSLGGGVALALARRKPLDAVITIGAFTRLRDMTSKITRGFIPDAYNNLSALPAIDEPWFLIHGSADATVPIGMGEKLHIAAGAAKRKGASFVVMGADHKPPADALIAIFDQIARRLSGAGFDPAALPTAIKVIPFGQSAPLNP